MTLPVIYNIFTNIEEKNLVCDNVAVVIFTCKPIRGSIVYDTTGCKDIDAAVQASVRDITTGCNYHYKFVKKVGNVYFFK